MIFITNFCKQISTMAVADSKWKANMRKRKREPSPASDTSSSWWEQVRFCNQRPPSEPLGLINRIIEEHPDNTGRINHLTFLIQNLNGDKSRRNYTKTIRAQLSLVDRDRFMTEIMHTQILGNSFLQFLNLFNHYSHNIIRYRNCFSHTVIGL